MEGFENLSGYDNVTYLSIDEEILDFVNEDFYRVVWHFVDFTLGEVPDARGDVVEGGERAQGAGG